MASGCARVRCSSTTLIGSTPRRSCRCSPNINITTFCAPPTMYRMLIKQDLSPLRPQLHPARDDRGRGAEPRGLSISFEKATGLQIAEGFGQTEMTLGIAQPRSASRIKPGSMGKPIPGYGIDLVNQDGNPDCRRRQRARSVIHTCGDRAALLRAVPRLLSGQGAH